MENLRKKAEEILKDKKVNQDDLSKVELSKLIEELQIQQIELQVQNDELRESRMKNEAAKKKYYNLFDLAPVGYLVLDKKGVIVECNLKATEIFGRRKDHIFNKPFVSMLDGQSMAKFYEYFEYAQKNKLHEEFELLIRKQKTLRNLQLAISLFSDNQYLIVFSDITEKKQIANKLKESEERFRLLINSTSDVVFTLDTDQKHTGIFGDWVEKAGLSADYFLGKTTKELLGDDAPIHIEANKKALNGEHVSYEWNTIAEHGTIYYQTNLSPLLSNGKVYGIIGVGRDITAVKEAEQILLEKNTTLEIAMQAGNMAWWTMEYPKGNISFGAKKAEMLGYLPEKFKHYQDFMDLVHPADRERAMVAMQNHLLGTAERYQTEYRIKAKTDEYIWFYDVGTIVEKGANGNPTKICGIVININERKRNENYLLKAKEEAEKNQQRLQQQKAEITLNNERLESLISISQLQTNSVQQVLDYALEEAIKLTASRIGYIYFYSEEKRQFSLNTWSKEVMDECKVMKPQTVYDLDTTGCWGEVVRKRKPIIINDYTAENPYKKGYPEGHVKLSKFLTIPVFVDNEIVAVAGVANKEEDYNEVDILQLNLLMDSVWKISERITLIDRLKTINKKLQISERESKERLKELNGIYNVGLLTVDIKNLDAVLSTIVKSIIPESMQFPEFVYVLLKIDDKTYSNNETYKLSSKQNCISVPLNVNKEINGELIVAYTKDLPFIKIHEQHLIETYAIRISSAYVRYHSQKALKDSQQQLLQITDNLPVLISQVNNDLKYVFVNKEYENIYNVKKEEIIGQKVEDFLNKAFFKKNSKYINQALKGEKAFYESTHITKNNGERFFNTTLIPNIVDQTVNGYTALIIDKTEAKLAENAIKESEIKLKELNATKDKFFSILAHDLKNPFSSILGFSDILVKKLDRLNSKKIRSFVEMINTTSYTTFKLLENLLEWSKSQSGKLEINPEKFKIENLIIEVIAASASSAKAKEITISYELSDTLSVFADKNMISTVVRNLVTNAIKFTPKNGSITITAIQLKNNIEIAITDTGIGMDAETISKLFKITEKISTLGTENEKGTGLGLILCKEFIEKHGGNIWVESQPEKGSTFKFTLPINSVGNTTKDIDLLKPVQYLKTILVAEDEIYNFLLIEEFLIDMDIELIHAKNGQETIEICQTNSNIDLILMDIKMPIMDGQTAAKKIKEFRPELPIMAQSAYAFNHEAEESNGIFDDYLTKPINETNLIEKVNKYIFEK